MQTNGERYLKIIRGYLGIREYQERPEVDEVIREDLERFPFSSQTLERIKYRLQIR